MSELSADSVVAAVFPPGQAVTWDRILLVYKMLGWCPFCGGPFPTRRRGVVFDNSAWGRHPDGDVHS